MVLRVSLSASPIALHFVVPVQSNQEVLIRLRGYDADGDALAASVTGFNGCGTTNCGSFYQLSQPYSAYGYEPKQGSSISTTPTTITGSANRFVFTPPKNKKAPEDKWGFFTYQSNDGGLSSAKPGIVAILASPANVLVSSSFTFDSDAWSVTNNGAGGVGVAHSASSRGLMNHYITSKDDEINMSPSTSQDSRLWYFVGPSKFLASSYNPPNLLAFGGSLNFKLSSQAGDFAASNLNTAPLVILECATCDSGMGIRLVHTPSSSFDGKQKQFSIPFTTSATNSGNGIVWKKDSRSSLIPFTETNDCELIEVLNGLSSLKILGDFTKWHESVSLDDVKMVAGHPVTIPLSCYPVG